MENTRYDDVWTLVKLRAKGWQILRLFGRRMYNHSGGIDGFSAHLAC
jgi:hypothetical protein